MTLFMLKRYFAELPLIKLIRHACRYRWRGTMLFLTLIFSAAVFLAALPVVPSIQRAVMAKFHLQYHSFPLWSLLQFVPSMYNFANEGWFSGKDFVPPETPKSARVWHVWVNHYPLRLIYFRTDRGVYFVASDLWRYATLRSRYQNISLITHYYLRVLPDGSLYLVAQEKEK